MGLFSRRNRSDRPPAPSSAGQRQAPRSTPVPFSGNRTGTPVFPEPGTRLYPDVPIWFERMADIPGLDPELPPTPPRTSLVGCYERPWVYFGGGPAPETEFRHLQWPGSRGFGQWTPSEFGHGWSPAHRLGVEQRPGRSAGQIVDELWPTLERPGVGLDFHFLLQGAVEELWKIRDSDPAARSSLVTVASIDMKLFEVFPECMLVEPDRPGQYFSSKSLERLAAVHEQLGNVEAAFEVTSFAANYSQLDARHRRLAKKLGRNLAE